MEKPGPATRGIVMTAPDIPMIDIPLIDISRWRTGDDATRAALAARTDAALQGSGFLMIENHGISEDLKERIRGEASVFFALPAADKAPLAAAVSGRGWLPPGKEANAFYGLEADPGKADLKESLTFGRDFSTGDAEFDAEWFAPNVYPAQTPDLEALCTQYIEQVRALYVDLLHLCATSLGLPVDWFERRARLSPHTFNINRYPPRTETGEPLDGQYRVGPHTDWGILTILDRQPGYGGLQVQTVAGDWADAPFVPGAFTINVGDLLERWTGNRWRSTRHRVLPPSAEAPDEELISLIVFLEADMTTVIEPMTGDAEPVIAGDYFRERSNAASV
jgi:isopenicillin N synthase-like dioxygenase